MDYNRKKVLLVDDSDLVCRIMKQFLETSGFKVVIAKNGVEGIQMAYDEIPDVIIMDVEMPMLQGYQASRLLKHRRGVKDIPIIMHTSMSEDRDQYWSFSSGVDAFIQKDFDNLDNILILVQRLSSHPPYNIQVIKDDARSMNKDSIFEMIGNLFDQQLFQSAVVNMLAEVGKSIGSLSSTASQIINILSKVCEYHLAIIFIRYNKEPVAYILPTEMVFKKDVDDFYRVCLSDFYKHFSSLNLETTRQIFLGIEDRQDFNKLRIDEKKISSYACFEIRGKGGNIIGSLHVGNLSNNYFSDYILNNISIFSKYAGTIIENAVLFNQVSEMQDKVRNVFSKFVPNEIIDDLVECQSEESLLVGEKRRVAVLFADIRSFTTISENNSAEDIVSFLNHYFNIMVGIIKKHGGTIDKFIGDAILALFGAPKSYKDNGLRAVNAAIEMICSLKKVNTDGLELSGGNFNIGIGIHEGVAIIGNIGSADKFDYTVIGDTVNLASRLEGLTRHYQKRIIVSQDIKDKVSDNIFLREVDTVKVKGKERSTSIFTVELDPKPFDDEFMNDYKKGLKLYKMGTWDTAIDYFNLCQKKNPEDKITRMFIKRCREFLKNPPENWDGSMALDFK